MNKILLVKNSFIPSDCSNIIIDNKHIKIISSGDYCIEYIDSDNISLDIELEKNIWVNLFHYSNNKNIEINNNYILNTNSSINISKFYINTTTNEKTNIYLNGDKSSVKYNFSSISDNMNKYIINIYHTGKNTSSNVFNRTIAKENSTNIFDINSYVENGIKDCYLNQHTKIITLGDSNNKINPNMFISEESTTAVHSSVIGNVSDDDLFYLMSRGINYNDSINLIIKGIIFSNIKVNMEYREKILKIIDNLGGE